MYQFVELLERRVERLSRDVVECRSRARKSRGGLNIEYRENGGSRRARLGVSGCVYTKHKHTSLEQ